MALFVSAVGLGIACPGHRSHSAPNVLLITVDTLRADHCSSYGYPLPTTPVLDALARDGVRLVTAYAPMSSTTPSHATMFTSLYPLGHGIVQNGLTLGGERQTLAETLRAAGYATRAVVSSFALDRRFGLDQGFDAYDDQFDRAHSSLFSRSWEAHRVTGGFDQRATIASDKAIRALQALGGRRPFFLWVHYFDPHEPYDPPERFRSAFPPADESEKARAIAAYDAEIAYTDHEIGRVLETLERKGLADDTLVIVVADHGEGLLQRGHMGHGIVLYEEGVRVPFVLRWPGRLPAGRTIEEPVALVDLLPTVLDLLDLSKNPEGAQGVSLAPALQGAARSAADREVFLQRRRYETPTVSGHPVAGDKFAIRKGRWKYIEANEESTRELFDLSKDPGERQNVAAHFPAEADRLSATIAAWRESHGPDAGHRVSVPADSAERLRALGYVR
jgi:arylsulfatase A-like enzyme